MSFLFNGIMHNRKKLSILWIIFTIFILTILKYNCLRENDAVFHDSETKQPTVEEELRTSSCSDHIKQLSIDLGMELDNISHPILTLMTTMRDVKYRKQIHLNTIQNWAYLSPWVVPVLFVNNITTELRNMSSWGTIAKHLGWYVLEYSDTIMDIPILKTMFSDVDKLQINSTFIGYANADILFEKNLIRTLFKLTTIIKDVRKETIFVSGQRINIKEELLNNMRVPAHPEHVGMMATDHKLFLPRSADYFIFTKAGLHWEQVPNFVVGIESYDTWIISAAVQWNIMYLDASNTIMAVHQTGPDGNHAGETTPGRNHNINKDMMSKDFNFEPGNHYCAPYYSEFEKTNDTFPVLTSKISITQRNQKEIGHRFENCAH